MRKVGSHVASVGPARRGAWGCPGVYLATEPVNFHHGHAGLCGIVRNQRHCLRRSPCDAHRLSTRESPMSQAESMEFGSAVLVTTSAPPVGRGQSCVTEALRERHSY